MRDFTLSKVNNQKVLTTNLYEDVVQGYSNQVKDLVEAKKGTTHKSSQSGNLNKRDGVRDLCYKFVRRPWTTFSNGFVVNTL